MATAKKGGDNPLKWVGRLHGTIKEATDRAAADAKRRENAPRILTPNHIAGLTKLKTPDAVQVLKTSMGLPPKAPLRKITNADLRVFKKSMAAVQARNFRAGITAQQIIDLSWPIDRQRAKEEIKVSMPVRSKSGVVQFMTDASGKYNATRHHVTVQFLSFEAAVVAAQRTPRSAAQWLRTEPLRFDCDCGRHTFWFRYIASIGGYAYGRAETGYPKVRNPELSGIACKHVIRTMAQVLSGSGVWNFLTRMVDAARKTTFAKSAIKTTQEEYEKEAAKQQSRAPSRREIKTTSSIEAKKEMQAIAKAIKDAPVPKRAAGATRAMVGKNAPKTMEEAIGKLHGNPREAIELMRSMGIPVMFDENFGKNGSAGGKKGK